MWNDHSAIQLLIFSNIAIEAMNQCTKPIQKMKQLGLEQLLLLLLSWKSKN